VGRVAAFGLAAALGVGDGFEIRPRSGLDVEDRFQIRPRFGLDVEGQISNLSLVLVVGPSLFLGQAASESHTLADSA